MDAIVTAGGIPKPEDPLYEYTKGISKAMLDVAGKPMVQWVLDALNNASLVDRIIVIGLSEENGLLSNKPLVLIPNQANMLENIIAGAQKVLEYNPNTGTILVVASDIPGLKPEMVDWLVRETQKMEADVHYTVVQDHVMEARYPNSRRSYTPLSDMRVAGGDIHAFRAELVTTDKLDTIRKLIANRKNVLKQAAIIGWGTLFLLLLRRLTLEQALKRAGKALGLVGHVIISPYAELGMDVDKPFQLDMVAADMGRKTGA